jgi:hypothetical protein
MFECYADLEEILEDRLSEQTDVIESPEEQDKGAVGCLDKQSPLRNGALPVAVD